MASVSSFINKIRTAIYGKEVRSSIADGIKAINDEVESTTERQNNLEITAIRTNNIRVTSSSHEYYDANNVLPGLVVAYAASGINVPATTGTLICLEPSATNGRTHLFITNGGVVYARVRWSGVWGSWAKQQYTLMPTDLKSLKTFIGYGRTNNDASATDCNTLPVNSIYLVTTNLLNLPYANAFGTIITMSSETTSNVSGVTQLMITNLGKLYLRINWSNSWGAWIEINKDPVGSDVFYGSFSLFETIGVIGDSYASGASGEQVGDTSAKDHPALSWPQQLGRKNGVSVTNYAKGGLSTRTFLTDAVIGLSKLISDPARGLYILALVRNDYNIEDRGETGYIGSLEDITSHSLGSYPDTFYGNYATIIESILNHAPNSKIVMMTADYKSTNVLGTEYNNAMKEIALHYNKPIMIQLDEPFFDSDYYRTAWAGGGHPSAIIYSGMELAIERMFSKCLNTYKSYFTYYKGIV